MLKGAIFLFFCVQIYDSPESELKLNDVFEFFGVLTFDSELPSEKVDQDEFSNGLCDDVSVNLPPNKVLTPVDLTSLLFCIYQHSNTSGH